MCIYKQGIVYLLGAGFSYALTERRAPLTAGLGKQLEDIFPEEIKEKYSFSADDIELFLTKIDLELESNRNNTELRDFRNKVNNKIVEIFTTKNIADVTNAKLALTLTAEKITKYLFRENDTIMTLNYDCYLENVLCIKKRWSTLGGWGDYFKFNQDSTNKRLKNIEILKLHGSINFILVAFINSDNSVPTERELSLEWFVNKEIFPESHEETGWENTEREYFILPSYKKHFHKKIIMLWKNAVLRISKTDKLVIIGTKLRKEDFYLNFAISFINKKAKIIIIDPQAEIVKNNLLSSVSINPKNIYLVETGIEEIGEDTVDMIYG